MTHDLFTIGLVACLAFYVAWNLGANDVANSMGTSVGAKALTLKQALLIAAVLEFTGALIFGHEVSATLAIKIINPSLFVASPQVLLLGMISVMLACGVWLQIATSYGLPVASSHAVVGAIAGFSWVAAGNKAVDWHNLGQICLAWLITPLFSGLVASVFYTVLRRWIFNQSDPRSRLQEWIPWLSTSVLGIFGVIVLPPFFNYPFFAAIPLPNHDLVILTGIIAAISLTWFNWRKLDFFPVLEKADSLLIVENIFSKFQVLSACFVAFAHGSNDVGNAIAPLAAIVYILTTNTVPLESINIPTWILILGGLGIVFGLAVQGKKVITTVGEGIIPLQPSSGFCAEIATATTILLASRFGLPVSTSHALVGSVVGIGILQKWQNIQIQTVKSVVLAWVITLPVTIIIGAVSFSLLQLILLSYFST